MYRRWGYRSDKFWGFLYKGSPEYSAEWLEIIDQISVEYGVNRIDVRRIMDVYFRMIREDVTNELFPWVELHGLGYFKPSLQMLRKHLEKMELRFEAMNVGKEFMDASSLSRVELVRGAYNRLKSEKEGVPLDFEGNELEWEKNPMPEERMLDVREYDVPRLIRMTLEESRELKAGDSEDCE